MTHRAAALIPKSTIGPAMKTEGIKDVISTDPTASVIGTETGTERTRRAAMWRRKFA